MLRWLILIVLLLPGVAQAAETVLHSAATANADGKNIAVTDKGSLGLTVTISGTATVTFQGSADGGTTWSSMNCIALGTTTEVTSTTSSDQYQCSVGGLTHARAPISGCSGCTVTVQASSSLASRGRSGGGGATTLDQAFDGGKTIDGASDLPSAMCVGDGTRQICFYGDATLGPVIRPRNGAADTDAAFRCWTNLNCVIYDVEGVAPILTIDPDAASVNAMYQFGTAYKPIKSYTWDADRIAVDGTLCTPAYEQALNSSPRLFAFSCADNNSSTFSGKIRMPKAWDLGTVTFTLSLFHGTTETITFAGDFSAQCRGPGDTIDSTYGTVQAADVSITTANQIAEATTAALTPNGTCAAEDWLLWKYVVDATNFSANAANSKVLGVTMKYSTSSLSD